MAQLPLPWDLQIPAGSTWSDAQAVKINSTGDPDGPWVPIPDGTPISAQIRATVASDEVLAEWSSSPTGEELTAVAADGMVKLGVPAAASADWAWTTGVWDLEADLAGVGVVRLFSGAVTVDPEVTR